MVLPPRALFGTETLRRKALRLTIMLIVYLVSAALTAKRSMRRHGRLAIPRNRISLSSRMLTVQALMERLAEQKVHWMIIMTRQIKHLGRSQEMAGQMKLKMQKVVQAGKSVLLTLLKMVRPGGLIARVIKFTVS